MLPRYIFLPALIFIGMVTSYEDIKIGKIRNIWIIIGLVYTLASYLIMSFFKVPDFKILFSNFFISVIVSYGLWKSNLWSAGDAKLFITYSLLLPAEIYSKIYFKLFPALGLLINIFIPATIFLLVKAIIRFTWRRDILKKVINKLFSYFNKNKFGLLKIVSGFSIIFLSAQILRQQLTGLITKILPDRNVLVLISFLAYKHLSSIFKSNKRLTFVAFLFLVVYFTLGVLYRLDAIVEIVKALKMALIVMLLFEGYNKITDLYIEGSKSKTIPFAIWMFLGVLISWFL